LTPWGLGLACGLWVLAAVALARVFSLSLRDDVAPVAAALGVVVAFVLYRAKEASERRRKSLEICEKQYLDKELREAVATIRDAVGYGGFDEAALLRRNVTLATLLLNYCESCCAGVVRGLYDRAVMREFLGPLARYLVASFLHAPAGAVLASPVFRDLPAEPERPFGNLRRVFPEAFAG
jgi:hypothetical protein